MTDLYYILLFFIFFIIVGIRLRHLAVLNVGLRIRPIIRVAFACPITWKYDVIDKTESRLHNELHCRLTMTESRLHY